MAGPSAVTATRSASRLLNLNARPTTKVGLLSILERGRTGEAVECADYNAWVAEFGSYSANAQQGPLGAKLLFEESQGDGGGSGASSVTVYGVRAVHSSTPANIATKTSVAAAVTLSTDDIAESAAYVLGTVVGPFALTDGLTLVINVDGAGNDTATFNATAASRTSTTGTYDLADGQTLTFSLNGGTVRTATFLTANFANIDAATPQEVVNVLNATIATYDMGGVASVSANAVKITSNILGTGSAINVTGGTANAALTFTTGSLAGTGDAVTAAAVTVAELKTLIEGDIAGLTVTNVGGAVQIESDTTGGSSSIVVSATSTMETILGLDTATHTGAASATLDTIQIDATSDGVWANSFNAKIAAASNGNAAQFNLQVLKGTVVLETFTNLSMVSTEANYFETVINEGSQTVAASKYITVTDLEAEADAPANIPLAGTFALAGGVDGIASIADADYVGGITGGKTAGLSCFDAIEDLDVIIVPDRTTSSFLNSLITYNNTRRRPAFLVFELPHGQSIAQIRTFVGSTAALRGLSERTAAYYPETYVDNPDTAVFGNAATVVAPISAQMAGLYARVDASRDGGAAISPAGTTLRLRTARKLGNRDIENPTNRGLVFDDLINPIMIDARTGGIYADGARTLKDDGPYPFVGQSRGITFLEHQCGLALDPQRHKNNTEALRSAIATEVRTFFRRLLANDFFASRVEDEAFVVSAGAALNPLSEQAAGNLNVGIETAMSRPSEFIKLNFTPLN